VDARRARRRRGAKQLENAARLPIVFKHIAAMPDVHLGIGATVGSVIPDPRAIIPAAVGVDIGCGMIACKTTLRAATCRTTWRRCAAAIERAVPHGRAKSAWRDKGSWEKPPGAVDTAWATLVDEFEALICGTHPKLKNTNNHKHLGTLGGGNHFIEVCLDEEGARVVHAALRLARRGQCDRHHFIELAKQDAELHSSTCPTRTWRTSRKAPYFGDYVRAVGWAQKFARMNREVMMRAWSRRRAR
jgi:tRNA-splicing ligase RtcB